MSNKYIEILYLFDLLGITPQINIFNKSSYKSLFSSLLSIIILIISFAFSLYSLIEYCKFDNPLVVYSKDNDYITNRTIFLKDTLLIFGLVDLSNYQVIKMSDVFYKSIHRFAYYNGTQEYTDLTLEKCELGKNINSKYIDFINNMKIISAIDYDISDFYCISSIYENLTISYLPNIGESSLLINTIINEDSDLIPERVQSFVIFENDIIDHINKSNPIKYYAEPHLTESYSSNKFISIEYTMQYIKYESDNGLILKNPEFIDAKTFTDIEYSEFAFNNELFNNTGIGSISIEMNKFFDHYKRSYTKLQTLLTEIVTIINLLFGIGHQICNFLLPKKMTKNIVQYLMIGNKIINNQYPKLNQLNQHNNIIVKDSINNDISGNKKEIKEDNNIKIEKNERRK